MLNKIKNDKILGKLFDDVVRPIRSCPPEDMPVPILTLDPKDPRIVQAKEEDDLDPYTVKIYFLFMFY